MGSDAAARFVADHAGKGKAREAERHEDPPIKVHSRWDLTHTTYWVDLDELFKRQRVKRALEVLKGMYEQDPQHRPYRSSR